MIAGRPSGFWCRTVDVAFSRVFSVLIPLPDQIVPEIGLSALGIILVTRLKSSSCFSQQYPPVLCAKSGIQRQDSEDCPALNLCISWRAASFEPGMLLQVQINKRPGASLIGGTVSRGSLGRPLVQ